MSSFEFHFLRSVGKSEIFKSGNLPNVHCLTLKWIMNDWGFEIEDFVVAIKISKKFFQN